LNDSPGLTRQVHGQGFAVTAGRHERSRRRLHLTLDRANSRSIRTVGCVKGAGYAGRNAPRHSHNDGPYCTDGPRVVLMLSADRYALEEPELLRREWPTGPIAGSSPALGL
jgi:hypothetical protein